VYRNNNIVIIIVISRIKHNYIIRPVFIDNVIRGQHRGNPIRARAHISYSIHYFCPNKIKRNCKNNNENFGQTGGGGLYYDNIMTRIVYI